MDVTIIVLWAFFFGAVFGIGAMLVVLEINWKKEVKRLEEKSAWRNYYDFCCWLRRKDKPIDFRIE